MPNQITRDIYVTKDVLKNPIHYVRGTDLIPIVMRFCDFSIPSGATARIFVGKPDGNAVYTSATIEGNIVTIDVTEQMFVTLGLALMQVSIMDGDEELVTFAQPVMVEPNLKAGDFPESSTDVTFLDDAIAQANEAVETATTAAQNAANAVQNANTAISNANEAIADVNQAVASMNANFANLAQVATINALQTTAKTVVGAINELNSNMILDHTDRLDISADMDVEQELLSIHQNAKIGAVYFKRIRTIDSDGSSPLLNSLWFMLGFKHTSTAPNGYGTQIFYSYVSRTVIRLDISTTLTWSKDEFTLI